jgi:hypothetical protein
MIGNRIPGLEKAKLRLVRAVQRFRRPQEDSLVWGQRNFKQFRVDFADVEGYYWPQSEAIWSFLLSAQNSCGISGNFLELGVFRGRSAHLAAQFLAKSDTCILVDLADLSAVGRRMAGYRAEPVLIQSASDRLNQTKAAAYRHSCRLIHVDGDHNGHGVLTDLTIAKDYLAQGGIIAVDDYYSPRYPQITTATCKWLDLNPEIRMVLCGFNKAYLVHTRDYDLYESIIRSAMWPYLEALGEDISLAKTSHAHDMGCWGAITKGERSIIGSDRDPDDIPY